MLGASGGDAVSERVRVGDVFEDLDPRMVRGDITGERSGSWRRRVKVIRIEPPGYGRNYKFDGIHCITPVVLVEDTVTRLRTRIRWDRLLRGGRRGYRKVKEEAAP